MKIYSIYRVTNTVTSEVYIGFSDDPTRRWKQHVRSAKSSSRALAEAIRKYGVQSFDHTIIYQSLDKDHTHKVMEPLFIEEYGSVHHGYNMTRGGDGWGVPTAMMVRYGVDNIARTSEGRARVSAQFSGTVWMHNIETGEYKRQRGELPSGWIHKGKPPDVSKSWRVTDPSGITFDVRNLNQFCKGHGLSQGNMVSVANGKNRHHKGYRCERIV